MIDADEVKAAHGATVGQLDANALFYLRSRGLPQAQAQALLSAAFCHEPLKILPDALRAQLAPSGQGAGRGRCGMNLSTPRPIEERTGAPDWDRVRLDFRC